MLDDLGHCIDARGFGDSFHEGIVSLMIRKANPHCPLQVLLGNDYYWHVGLKY
jgi:hypothetical protein